MPYNFQSPFKLPQYIGNQNKQPQLPTNNINSSDLLKRGISAFKNYISGVGGRTSQNQPIMPKVGLGYTYEPPKLANFQIPQFIQPKSPQPQIQNQISAIQGQVGSQSINPPIQSTPIQPQINQGGSSPIIQPQNPQQFPQIDYNSQLEAIKSKLGEISGGLSSINTAPTVVAPQQKEDSLSRIEKAIISAQTPTIEETEAEKQYANLLASREMGLQAISEKPIAMPFITGQQAALERRAAIQTLPLQSRLAQLQAKRQVALDIAKTQLGVEEAREKRKTTAEKPIEVGGRLVDPTTGKVIYEPPIETKELKAPTTIETAGGIMQWDTKTGTWQSTGFVKPTPTGVLEKQAEKAMEKQETETAKQQQATQSLGVVNDLLTNPSLTTVFGYLGGRIGGIVPGKAQLALNQFNQLKAQLALGARQLIKGSGQISDYESRVLNQSTSALGRTLSDKDAIQSLKSIRGVLRTNVGLETPVRVYDASGKIIGEGNLTGQDIFDAISDGNRVEYQ